MLLKLLLPLLEAISIYRVTTPQSLYPLAECVGIVSFTMLNLSKLKKVTATKPQPNRNRFKCFAIF